MKRTSRIAEHATLLDTQSVQSPFPCGSQMNAWFQDWIQTVNTKKQPARAYRYATFLTRLRENVHGQITAKLARLIKQLIALVQKLPAVLSERIATTALVIKQNFTQDILLAKQLNTQTA